MDTVFEFIGTTGFRSVVYTAGELFYVRFYDKHGTHLERADVTARTRNGAVELALPGGDWQQH